MIKCPGCGAALRFDPHEQLLVCDHCGSKYEPDQFEEYKYSNKAEEEQALEVTLYKCPNCGAELVSTDDTAATFCSYCGSNVMMESRMGRIEYPTRILPFRLDKKDAETAYKKKLRESLFAPSDLKKDSALDKFRGIYMPYWNYEYETSDTLHTTGKTQSRRGDYVYRKYYDITADVAASYDAAYFDASVNFADDLSRSVKPFNTKEIKDFNAAYMSGFYADAGDVRKSLYEPEAFEQAVSYMADEALGDSTLSHYGVSGSQIEKSIHVTNKTARMSLFPVWFMSLRSRNGKRISYAAVNGQTGKVAADIPIDVTKYLLFSLVLAVPIFLLFTGFLTLTPGKALFLSIILNIIGLLILRSNIRKAKETDDRTKDKAFQEKKMKEEQEAAEKDPENRKKSASMTVKKNSKPMSAGLKFLLIIVLGFVGFNVLTIGAAFIYELAQEFLTHEIMYWIMGGLAVIALIITILVLRKKKSEYSNMAIIKPLLGILACVIVYMIKPVQDYWYYGAAIFAIIMMLLSVVDIIKRYNISATHKMPQLMSLFLAFSLGAACVLSPLAVSAAGDFRAEIEDDADLLTDEEEQLLMHDMLPLTAYGHIAFASISENPTTTSSYAAQFYYGRYGNESGTVLLIDMDNREIYLVSAGHNYNIIDKGKAYSITDNSYRYASKGEYYQCAKSIFEQCLTVLEGGRIAEPMKHISNALLSILIALLISFLIVSSAAKKREATLKDLIRSSQAFFSMSEVTPVFLRETKTYDPITSDSGSSGGGFSGGGGGGFSGGGGGGGGGFSGGGGGHSF